MSAQHDDVVDPEFDPHAETYYVTHASENTWPVSTTLVLSLASLTGDEPTAMSPLDRTVDTAALESLVAGGDVDGRVSFEFHGHDVTVRNDGRIEFSPADGPES